MKKKKFQPKYMKIYIDGSCRPNSRLGAYGVLVIDDKGHEEVFTGTQEDVTNNIMELTALIEALKLIIANEWDKQFEIEIFCDSQYVVKGATEWWVKWKANGYNTSTGPVKNLDLWKHLEKLMKKATVKLTWVKGHAVCIGNNSIDKIVYELTAPAIKPNALV